MDSSEWDRIEAQSRRLTEVSVGPAQLGPPAAMAASLTKGPHRVVTGRSACTDGEHRVAAAIPVTRMTKHRAEVKPTRR